jgi:hypothetical protein
MAYHCDYPLYLAINDIDHTKTKAKSPQTTGISERFNRIILNDCYRSILRHRGLPHRLQQHGGAVVLAGEL